MVVGLVLHSYSWSPAPRYEQDHTSEQHVVGECPGAGGIAPSCQPVAGSACSIDQVPWMVSDPWLRAGVGLLG